MRHLGQYTSDKDIATKEKVDYAASVFAKGLAGLDARMETLEGNITRWDAAFGWGDHADMGYAFRTQLTDGSVTKVGTSTIGASNIPIYLNAGIPTQVSSVGEAFLSWGGRNFTGDYGPIDAAMVGDLGANRLAFVRAAGVVIQYSRDGGSTWTDYGASDTSKVGLFSIKNGASFNLGKAGASQQADFIAHPTNYLLRIYLRTSAASVYTVLNKLVFYVSTNSSQGSYVTLDVRTQDNYEKGVDSWVNRINKMGLSGWSGFNVANITGTTTYGNQKASHYGEWRFTFGCTGYSPGTKADGTYNAYYGLCICSIFGFGGVGWTTPSTMATTGHLYSFDASQNATFPADIYAKVVRPTSNNSYTLGTSSYRWSTIYGTALNLNGEISGATTGSFSSNVTIGGTLGVTGKTTLKSALIIDSNTIGGSDHIVFNRGSWNYIRASAANGILAFISYGRSLESASIEMSIQNNKVAIAYGTTAPSYTLDVNGETRTKGVRIWNGSKEVVVSVDSDGNLKFDGNIYATGFMSAGGVSDTAAGGGLDWTELTTQGTQVIHASHIPSLDISKISNISSASVSYAASAGSVAWDNVSGKPSSYTPSSHTHSDLYGTTSNTAVPSTSLSAGQIHYYYNVNNGLTGNMPSSNNANGLLMINRYSGDYHSFLGFSSDGRLYYKTALSTSASWNKIAWTSDIPSLSGYATQTWVENKGYTTNTGTVTSVAVKMNNAVKGTITSSGTIDLGTVITAHQDISGKQDKITSSNKLAYSLISGTPTSLPASDVYAWAKSATKPSYAFSELTSHPTTISGYGITDAITTSNIGSQSVSKSSYSSNLVGRNASGTEYAAISGNLIYPVWNLLGDNRWYLQADGYDCRVGHASSASVLSAKSWRGDNSNGDATSFTGYKKLATLQCSVWMVVNATFAVHSRHGGTLRYSLSLRLDESYASYDCFIKAFGVVTEYTQLRFFYNTSTGVFTIWKQFYDYDYTYVTTEYSTYLEFNGDDTQYSDIPAGQGTEIGVDVNVANSINNNELVLKNPYDPTNYRITLRSDWDWAAHTRLFGANGYELLRGVRDNLSLMPDNNGNVGVGVVAPSTKLHVNGRIAVNGPEILNWTTANGLAQTSELSWYGMSKYDCADGTGGWGLRIANFFGMQYCVGGNYQHYFEGRITCSSEITAYSDRRLKGNIQDLSFRGRLTPKSYIKDGKQSIGFIAQEVREKYPELVHGEETEDSYLSLNYGAISAVLAAQLNQTDDEVTTLKKKVASLEARIKELEER